MSIIDSKPLVSEYAPFYGNYVAHVIDQPIEETLLDQLTSFYEFIMNLDNETANFKYAEGKWSIKELIGHTIDAERVFAYRALCFARGEMQSLPGFDENEYVNIAEFSQQSPQSLAQQFKTTRESTIALFSSMDEKIMLKMGVANGSKMTVRGVLFVLAGHLSHHMHVLKEKYNVTV